MAASCCSMLNLKLQMGMREMPMRISALMTGPCGQSVSISVINLNFMLYVLLQYQACAGCSIFG